MSYFNNRKDDVGLNPMYVAALKFGGAAAARNWDERGILPGTTNLTAVELLRLSPPTPDNPNPNPPGPVVPVIETAGASFGMWFVLLAVLGVVWYLLSPKGGAAVGTRSRSNSPSKRSGNAPPEARTSKRSGRRKRARVSNAPSAQVAKDPVAKSIERNARKTAKRGTRKVSQKTLDALARGRAKRAANLARKR